MLRPEANAHRNPGDDSAANHRNQVMTPNQLFIVNDFDRPQAKHIARQGRHGKFFYVHPLLRNVKQFHGMTPTDPTPVSDFGISLEIRDGAIYGKLDRESVATYRDGKPRKWQCESEFKITLPIRKKTHPETPVV